MGKSVNDAGEQTDCSIEDTLKQRGSRYGEFKDNAKVANSLMAILTQADRESRNEMTMVQREALHIVAQKLARIVNGDPNYDDNWRDIAGYCTLVMDYCEEK